VEAALRAAVLSAGAKVLESLLAGVGRGRRDDPVFCACGTRMESRGVEEKTILTILGPVRFTRSRFQCPECRQARYPGDEALDVTETTRSPGVRRMVARAGSRQTFKEAKEDLRVYAAIEVSAKDVERGAEKTGREVEAWQARERAALLSGESDSLPPKTIPVMYIEMDGTGVPMVPSEVAGRKGKQPDGSARTREAKIGCVFTQTTTDEKGRPVRDPDSTTFVGAIETADEFGRRIEAEAIRRGLSQAWKVVVLGDGAVWIRTQAELRFLGAILIVDLFHAREHVAELARLLFFGQEREIQKHRLRWWTDLDQGQVEKIIREARARLSQGGDQRKKAEQEIGYLEQNVDRMRYDRYRKQGLFVGSGGGRGGMQKRHRGQAQTVGHGVVPGWSQRHHRPPLQHPLRTIRGLLGRTSRLKTRIQDAGPVVVRL